MLSFYNPGNLDLKLLTTFGASVKESDNPIGYFGTGLKYAIAVSLRHGAKVLLETSGQRYTIRAQTETIRGKEFQMVYLTGSDTLPVPCGFTLDLGKNWEPWAAFREFYSNALDEHGGVTVDGYSYGPHGNGTVWQIESEIMDRVWSERKFYFIDRDRTPLYKDPAMEIYPGASAAVFYRGIKVCALPKTSLYTYNITAKVDLTEDRTLHYWYADGIVATCLARCNDRAILTAVLSAHESTFEGSVNYPDWFTPSDEFMDTVTALSKTKFANVPSYARAMVRKRDQSKLLPESCRLTIVEEAMLARAQEFVTKIGFEITEPIVVTDTLGKSILGMATNGTIFVSKAAFALGTKVVAGTLIEEHIHLKHELHDESRAMQEFLLNKLVSLGEELQGSPL
jgi:hypothetical protein